MPQAKVFELSRITIGGEPITREQLTDAVDEFNEQRGRSIIAFGNYMGFGHRQINLKDAAGMATLDLVGDSVIADIYLFKSPAGKIATELLNRGLLRLMPVTDVIFSNAQRKLSIHQLVFPTDPSGTWSSPLQKVQAWVQGVEYWPLFDVKENKY